MTQIDDFNAMLNWKLLKGSHDFPGPGGGTCINEAAIVAAGFKYKKVNLVDDMPPCFSRVICQYALTLNDTMPDDVRTEKLAPYIVRLAGTADTDEIERQRAEYLAWQAIKVFAPSALTVAGLHEHAKAQKDTNDLLAAYAAARAAAHAAANVANAAANAAAYAAGAWDDALAALEGALAIGNQAEPIETALINERASQFMTAHQEGRGGPVAAACSSPEVAA